MVVGKWEENENIYRQLDDLACQYGIFKYYVDFDQVS